MAGPFNLTFSTRPAARLTFKIKSRRRFTMNRLKHSLYSGFVVSILGLMMGVQFAAAKPRPELASWDNLKRLLPGEEIRVVLNDGKSYRGLLQTVTDQEVAVRLATGDQTFARENILRISAKGESHRGRNAAEGAAIGALGVGAAISIAAANPLGMFAGLFLGGGPGALIGAVLPTGGWRDVYRPPKKGKEESARAGSGGALPAQGR